jgi:AcrR family transcriptional regulator
MGQPAVPRRRLDRRTWAAAALEALAEGGPGAVAVEPVARRLGTTKGSFYWHFPDRQALLLAALELYEQESTEAVIASLQHHPNREDQLRSLVDRVFRSESGDAVYHVLLANATDPNVAPVLKRITARRVEYLVEAMTELGYSRGEGHQRAVLAYTTWLGLVETERALAGELFSSKEARRGYVAFLQRLILERPGRTPNR